MITSPTASHALAKSARHGGLLTLVESKTESKTEIKTESKTEDKQEQAH